MSSNGKSVAIVAMGASKIGFFNLASQLGGSHKIADKIWAINSMGGVIKHDLLFHMDDCKIQEARAERQPDANVAGMLSWLKTHPNFITSRVYEDYPGAIEFPLAEVLTEFKTAYLNNTVAYAFVYAMFKGFKEIWLFGCDYSYPNQHQAERGRGCMEFWIAIALSRGLKVHIGDGSTLMDASIPEDQRLYGYDTEHVELDIDDDTGKTIVTRTPLAADRIPTSEMMEERYNHEPNN